MQQMERVKRKMVALESRISSTADSLSGYLSAVVIVCAFNLTIYVATFMHLSNIAKRLMGELVRKASIDGDLASTRTDVQAMHIMADSEQRFTLWASYLTRMRREGDQWLICRHELAVRATELA